VELFSPFYNFIHQYPPYTYFKIIYIKLIIDKQIISFAKTFRYFTWNNERTMHAGNIKQYGLYSNNGQN